TSIVCPPDTMRTTTGNSSDGSSTSAAYRCASRWFTATNGTPHTSASAFAALTPTSSDPTRPGPTVAATASMSRSSMAASTTACATTGQQLDVGATRDLGNDAAVAGV